MVNAWSLLYDELYGDDEMSEEKHNKSYYEYDRNDPDRKNPFKTEDVKVDGYSVNGIPNKEFLSDTVTLGDTVIGGGNWHAGGYDYISAAANVDIPSTVWWRNTDSLPEKENFIINWRPTSDRIVVIFSDEPEQSYLRDINDPEGPIRPITEAIVEDAVRAGINLKVYAFSAGHGLAGRAPDWEDITAAGRGTRFQLTSNAVSMYNDLMSIIDEACLPRDEDAEEEQALYRAEGYMTMPASTINTEDSRLLYYTDNMCLDPFIAH